MLVLAAKYDKQHRAPLLQAIDLVVLADDWCRQWLTGLLGEDTGGRFSRDSGDCSSINSPDFGGLGGGGAEAARQRRKQTKSQAQAMWLVGVCVESKFGVIGGCHQTCTGWGSADRGSTFLPRR